MGNSLKKSLRKETPDSGEDLDFDPNTHRQDSIDPSSISVTATLRAAYRDVQLSSQHPQEIPCALALKSEVSNESEFKVGTDIVCVVDRSGSMEGNKVHLLKETLDFLADQLSDSDRLAVVAFNNSAQVLGPLTVMNLRGKALIKDVIPNIQAGGGTNIVSGLESALKMLLNRKKTNTVTGIILLSDGNDNEAGSVIARTEVMLRKYSNDIAGGFSIHSFGYGADHDSQLLRMIAEQRNGGFYYVETPESVPYAFSNCVGELLYTVADSITVTLSALPIGLPYSLTKVYSSAQGGAQYTMPPILSNNTKDSVFLLRFDPTEQTVAPGSVVAPIEATVSYRFVPTGAQHSVTVTLEIPIVNENEDHTVEVYEDVMVSFYRAKGSDILKEAKGLAETGEYAQAQELLKKGAEELRQSIVASNETVQTVIKDLERSVGMIGNQANYEQGGRAFMGTVQMGHQEARANHYNSYQNSGQERFLCKAAARFS